MTDADSQQSFIDRITEKQVKRAAENARTNTQHLAMKMYVIDQAEETDLEFVTSEQFSKVLGVRRDLANRVMRNDHGIDEWLLTSYVNRADDWMRDVIQVLFEQAGR